MVVMGYRMYFGFIDAEYFIKNKIFNKWECISRMMKVDNMKGAAYVGIYVVINNIKAWIPHLIWPYKKISSAKDKYFYEHQDKNKPRFYLSIKNLVILGEKYIEKKAMTVEDENFIAEIQLNIAEIVDKIIYCNKRNLIEKLDVMMKIFKNDRESSLSYS